MDWVFIVANALETSLCCIRPRVDVKKKKKKYITEIVFTGMKMI